MFTKLINKNEITPPKVVPSTQSFHNPYLDALLKIDKNLMDPPLDFRTGCISWFFVKNK
jgi:hypothetical protein